jgi:hypothetical protein
MCLDIGKPLHSMVTRLTFDPEGPPAYGYGLASAFDRLSR